MTHPRITSTARQTFEGFAPAFVEYSDEILFGDLWRREELSLRDRSLVTVSALVAGQHINQLPYHLNLARQNGLSDDELIEAITHLAFYVGWPRAASALTVAKQVLKKVEES